MRIKICAAVIAATCLPSFALAANLQFTIDLPGDAEQRVIKYQCENEDTLRTVTYINSTPNFLAILTLDETPLIMSSVISGSGVQYVSGQYAWATSGTEASLIDLSQGSDAPPIASCSEVNDIP